MAMSRLDTVIQDLVIANRILAKEEVVDAYGHVSIRHPDHPNRFLIARSLAPDLVGPEDIVEHLRAVEKRYPGLNRVICATPLGTPLEVQLQDLDRFAKEVMPAFRDTRTAAAAE